jgi:hypothetical protein
MLFNPVVVCVPKFATILVRRWPFFPEVRWGAILLVILSN